MEETPGHKSSIFGRAFQMPSSRTGNLSLASGLTSALNLQVPGVHQHFRWGKSRKQRKKGRSRKGQVAEDRGGGSLEAGGAGSARAPLSAC